MTSKEAKNDVERREKIDDLKSEDEITSHSMEKTTVSKATKNNSVRSNEK